MCPSSVSQHAKTTNSSQIDSKDEKKSAVSVTSSTLQLNPQLSAFHQWATATLTNVAAELDKIENAKNEKLIEELGNFESLLEFILKHMDQHKTRPDIKAEILMLIKEGLKNQGKTQWANELTNFTCSTLKEWAEAFRPQVTLKIKHSVRKSLSTIDIYLLGIILGKIDLLEFLNPEDKVALDAFKNILNKEGYTNELMQFNALVESFVSQQKAKTKSVSQNELKEEPTPAQAEVKLQEIKEPATKQIASLAQATVIKTVTEKLNTSPSSDWLKQYTPDELQAAAKQWINKNPITEGVQVSPELHNIIVKLRVHGSFHASKSELVKQALEPWLPKKQLASLSIR